MSKLEDLMKEKISVNREKNSNPKKVNSTFVSRKFYYTLPLGQGEGCV